MLRHRAPRDRTPPARKQRRLNEAGLVRYRPDGPRARGYGPFVSPSPWSTSPTANRLLDSLPAAPRARVLGGCVEIQLRLGERLAEPGENVAHVYFPSRGAVSCLLPMAGHVLEACLVGPEGLLIASVARGRARSQVRAEVRLEGAAWRMTTDAFRRHVALEPSLATAVDGYMDAVHAQLLRASGCNRFHHVDQRVARCLLMMSDRARSDSFALTHETLGHALGVRRVGVTNAASQMQRRQLISYVRGLVTIVDRKGLEGAACGCYREDLEAYARAMPTMPRARRPAGR